MLRPDFSSYSELPHNIMAVMPWLSNLPVSEAQKIEGSSHHGHTSPGNHCSGENAPHVHPVGPGSLSFPVTQSKHFSINVFSSNSLHPNWVYLWPHTLVLLVLCHLPITPMLFTILQLAAVMLYRGIIKVIFYERTFSNRFLRTGITFSLSQGTRSNATTQHLLVRLSRSFCSARQKA